MSAIFDFLVNLWRFARNTLVGLLGRAPGFVWIEVGGTLPEFETPVGFVRKRLTRGPSPLTLQSLRERLARISADGRPRGVVLRLRDVEAGWASLEEAREELLEFRSGGGRVVAYLSDPVDTRSYYLATAADEILAAPLVTVGVTGVRTRVSFFKDALERLGIGAEVVAVSPYKSAGETFTRNDFSAEAREQAQRLLDGRYEELVRAVAGARGLTPAEAREKIDRAPYGAEEAVAARLVDGVCYEDELAARLAGNGDRVRLAEWGAARKSLKAPYRRRSRRRVGMVQVSGTIMRGRSRKVPIPLPFLGGERAGSESVVAALRGAEGNGRVAAVILHVESPGGDALASDLIWREVQRISARKPVVVLMGNVAASGGYYVSAPAAHVVSRRTTVTGSIGVITIRPYADRLYEKLGVNPVGLERGGGPGSWTQAGVPRRTSWRCSKARSGASTTSSRPGCRAAGTCPTSKASSAAGSGAAPRRSSAASSTMSAVSGGRFGRPASSAASRRGRRTSWRESQSRVRAGPRPRIPPTFSGRSWRRCGGRSSSSPAGCGRWGRTGSPMTDSILRSETCGREI
ncbi:signal peptide peptidase SppA [Rubrobacter tropicus]|uniref:Signal peptide peptidase SppA n=1 Tax=Rubrobacter tropicus TaxID=2653851 RepID=A0A6G8Q8F1_9ACTN|nr:S49 family peptidase [Rubrobacter tropicus]QIN82764.1 signal peptide peptidase SppA [Rubrobacter tropicus]